MLSVISVTLPFKYGKYFVSRHRRQVLRSGAGSDGGSGSSVNTWHKGQVSMKSEEVKTLQSEIVQKVEGKFYTLFIDSKEYHTKKSELTGVEIMDMGGIPHELGLILILEDGTQVQVREDEVIDLKPGRRFKKAPRFVRG